VGHSSDDVVVGVFVHGSFVLGGEAGGDSWCVRVEYLRGMNVACYFGREFFPYLVYILHLKFLIVSDNIIFGVFESGFYVPPRGLW